jgi:D-3-phosphoglycerate dehydrogenase
MSARFQVLITDRFDLDAHTSLMNDASLSVKKSDSTTPSASELADVQGLLIRSRTKITEDLLANTPQLKVIITATSGFDHIDLEATLRRKIKVMFTPEANAQSAAELTWALAIAGARKVVPGHQSIKAGEWKRHLLTGRELRGRTYGIVGLGRIGTRVARMAHAFGMTVLAFDPYKDEEHFAKERAQRVSLIELFMQADILSVHVPATRETEHMIWRMHFENANDDLFFINTSRGSVVEEKVLIEALDQELISGCALDVFETEPLPRQSGLIGRANVILTPHIGAATTDAFKAGSHDAAEKIRAFVKNGSVSDPLPPQETWMEGGFLLDKME